jgi:hypothetical protein
MVQGGDWVADVVGAALGLSIAGIVQLVRRSRAARSRRPRWLAAAGVQDSSPVALTDSDVWLRRPDQPRHHDWRRGQLLITPQLVRWRPGAVPRTPVDLTHAELIRSHPAELSTDWVLPGGWQVLVMRAGGESLEISGPPPALDDLMSRLRG